MFDLFAQNGIGGEVVVWLIIAFFWVVAQLFSRKKEQEQRRAATERSSDEPVTEEEQRSLETEMRRFFEQIGAEPPEEETAPPPPPQRRERQRPPLRSAQQPRRAQQTERSTPPPLPAQEKWREAPAAVTVDTPRVRDPRLGEIDSAIDTSALDTDNAYAIREISRDESINAFVDPRNLLLNLNYLRMNMPIVPVTGLSTTSESRPIPNLHGRKALRDAITAQLILSNPLAMGEDKGSYTKRVV